jgi:hypothetical protein
MSTLRLVPATGTPMEAVGDSVLVGRDPASDIVLPDGSVSRRHARLERRGDDWAVIDQGSANGTFLDNQRTAEAILRHGQSLRLGSVVLRVEIEGAGDTDVGATVVSSGMEPGATVVSTATVPPHEPSTGTPPPVPRPAPPPPPLVPKKATGGKRPAVWIGSGCCGCLILIAIIVGAVMALPHVLARPAASAVEQQMLALRQGDLATAYGELSEELQSRMDPGDFERFVNAVPVLRQNTEVRITRKVAAWGGGSASIGAEVTSVSGMQRSVEFRLVKEQGVWKISEINVVQPSDQP